MYVNYKWLLNTHTHCGHTHTHTYLYIMIIMGRMAYHWWSVAFWASSICMNPHESPLSLSTQSCWGILGYCVAGLALPDHLSGQVAGSSLLLPWTSTYFWDHSSWVGLSALDLLCDWNLHWPLLWGASGYLLCGQRTVEPKPRRRGGGRVQHASVQSKLIVDFLTAVFNHVEFGDLLYRIAYHPCKLQTAMGLHLEDFLAITAGLRLAPDSFQGGEPWKLTGVAQNLPNFAGEWNLNPWTL